MFKILQHIIHYVIYRKLIYIVPFMSLSVKTETILNVDPF